MSESAEPLRILGVVPCAGRSTRMGRSKALLDADGAPFLVRVVDALRDGGCAPVVVVVRDEGSPEARLARSCQARVVVNPDPSPGPISSIRSALSTEPEANALCVLPVDHPRVRGETVGRMLEAGRTAGPAVEIVLPRSGDERGHPALFFQPTFGELMDPTLDGGARTVVRRDPARVLEVEVDDPGILQDIDDPAAYEAAFPHGPEAAGG